MAMKLSSGKTHLELNALPISSRALELAQQKLICAAKSEFEHLLHIRS